MATMTATITLQEAVRWQAQAGSGHTVIVDGPAQAGGTNAGFRPMELMLMGLGSCMAFDMLLILQRMREEVTGYQVELVGQRTEEPPTVYTEVTLQHTITGRGIAEASVKRALNLAEHKYCSASAMFAKTARLVNTYRIVEAD